MKHTQEYKKRLEEERMAIVGELAGLGSKKDSRDPDNWEAKPDDIGAERADPNDVADKIESYEKNTAMVGNFETRLREVDSALEKIGDNTYGTCEVCGKEIEENRLDANPAAKTCKAHMDQKS